MNLLENIAAVVIQNIVIRATILKMLLEDFTSLTVVVSEM